MLFPSNCNRQPVFSNWCPVFFRSSIGYLALSSNTNNSQDVCRWYGTYLFKNLSYLCHLFHFYSEFFSKKSRFYVVRTLPAVRRFPVMKYFLSLIHVDDFTYIREVAGQDRCAKTCLGCKWLLLEMIDPVNWSKCLRDGFLQVTVHGES